MRIPSVLLGVSVMLAISSTVLVHAQEVSDTDVTSVGNVHLEAGGEYTDNDDDGTDEETYAVPSLLFRTGLTERLEGRIGWAGYQWSETEEGGDEDRTHGGGDMNVEAKYLLTGEKKKRPRTALIAGASLPVGAEDFTSHRVDPVVLGALSRDLAGRFTLEAHAGVNWETEDPDDGERDTLASGEYATALFYRTGKNTTVFLEGVGSIPINASGTPAHRLHVGTNLSLSDDLALDLWVGRGLSDAAVDWNTAFNLNIYY